MSARPSGFWDSTLGEGLIAGNITGPVAERTQDTNPTTRVLKRFTAADWTKQAST